MSKNIIIIGAGIAGLSAGIYAKRSGFDVTILEQHTISGGMCTGWKRKGYLFDGAMHWLTGSAPGTTLTVFLGGDSYDFWKKARNEGRYEEQKQIVADQVIDAISQKFTQTQGKFEVVDVATPLTYERYTSSSKGSWMSVMEKGKSSMNACPCTLEDIKGVYFAGHRTMPPGGMPVALYSGRSAAQMVCRQFDVVFKS